MATPPTLITPKFLLPYPAPVSDYRCVVNADATAAIVERTTFTANGSVGPQLCLLDLTKERAEPTFLLPGLDVSTRPDWSWVTGAVAFNYTSSVMVGVLQAPGGAATLFGSSTTGMNYPTWFPDGTTLATEDDNGSPSPNTTTISASTGAVIQTALEGKSLWGGMPSVNPASPNLIAFAGQPVVGSTYNQDQNYIYVMDTSSSDAPTPLETGAPTSGKFNPAYQGRAPWWSPDGEWIVFESKSTVAIRGGWALRHLPLPLRRLAIRFADHEHNLQLQPRQVVSKRVFRRSVGCVSVDRSLVAQRPDKPLGRTLRFVRSRPHAARHYVLSER